MLDICLLGTGGMMPLPDRSLSSVLVRFGGSMLLLDCGEGTQISQKRLGWGFKEVAAIGISHFHADHVAGLPGMLLMVGNSGRREEMLIFGPKGLKRVVRGLRTIAPELPYPVRCLELAGGERFTAMGLEIACLAVDHAIPCLAYSLHVPRSRRFDPDRARALGLPVQLWKTLQQGRSVRWRGRTVRPDEVLAEERPGLKVVYVTDTRPTPALPDFVRGADLLICEGTYGDPADTPKAIERKHLTFAEAASLARDGQARQLWITHFSPAVTDPEQYLDEARRIFPGAALGHDRECRTLRFRDED